MRFRVFFFLILLFALCVKVYAQFPGPLPMLAVGNSPSTPAPITSVTLNGGSTGSYTSGIAINTPIGPIVVTKSNGAAFSGTLSLINSASFVSTAISCGGSCSFTAGTASTVGSLSAQLSSGTFTGGWSLQTTGTVGGHTCDNSGYFSISGNNLNVSSSGVAGTYYVCYVATETGITGSPYPNLVTVIGHAGGTIACNIGPNYSGSIPEPAQAEGYTTCYANYDFTSTATFSNGTGGSGYNFSNLSTWLYCNGSYNPTGPLWYVIDTGNGVSAPCSDMSIVSDAGSNSLQLTFTPTDWNNSVTYIDLQSTSNQGNPNPPGTNFPNGAYVEQVYEVPQSTFNNLQPDTNPSSGGALIGGIWEYGTGTNGLDVSFQEIDFAELYVQNGYSHGYRNAADTEHCSSSYGGFNCGVGVSFDPSQYDSWLPTSYVTYGNLNTFATNGNFGECVYINGSPAAASGQGNGNGCANTTFAEGNGTAGAFHSSLIIWDGAQAPGQDCGDSNPCQAPTGNVTLLIKRITVFTCSAGTSTGCPVATVPTSPP